MGKTELGQINGEMMKYRYFCVILKAYELEQLVEKGVDYFRPNS